MATPRKSRRNEPQPEDQDHTPQPKSIKYLKPFNKAQEAHLAALKAQTCVYATGPAGTGKTFVMAAYAAQQLVDNNIDKIVITRPTVEAGSKGIGYLKGDLNDKFLVWTWPFLKGFHFILGKSYYEYLRKIERIDICPIQFAQGMSFGGVDERVLILCDEFENATIQEMKMILTRVGEGARIFISGDTQQSMIRESGLLHSIHLLRNVPGVAHIRYTSSDIVRSEFTRRVVDAFDTIQYSTDYHGVFAPQ